MQTLGWKPGVKGRKPISIPLFRLCRAIFVCNVAWFSLKVKNLDGDEQKEDRVGEYASIVCIDEIFVFSKPNMGDAWVKKFPLRTDKGE